MWRHIRVTSSPVRKVLFGLEEYLFADRQGDFLAAEAGEQPFAHLVAGQRLRLDVPGVERALPDLAHVGHVDQPNDRFTAANLLDLGNSASQLVDEMFLDYFR